MVLALACMMGAVTEGRACAMEGEQNMATPASPTPQPHRRRRGTIVAALAVFLVVAAVAAVLVDRAVTPALGHPWHDALGFFSVTVPDGWKMTEGGISDAPGYQDAEFYWFRDTNQGDTFTENFVEIEVKGDNVPAAPCPLGPGYGMIPATVDGWTTYTAQSNDPRESWNFTFDSADASFTVSVYVVNTTESPAVRDQAHSLIDSLKTSTHGPC